MNTYTEELQEDGRVMIVEIENGIGAMYFVQPDELNTLETGQSS